MTKTRPSVFAVIGAVVAAVFAVSFLIPHVDRLSVTLGVGFSEGASTPETTRFAADMERLLRPADASAAIALLVILFGGLPLTIVALIVHHWPGAFGPLSRNVTVIWLCLTWQMSNVVWPWLFIAMLSSDGLDAGIVVAMAIAAYYSAINLVGAKVWRALLNRLHDSRLARVVTDVDTTTTLMR